MSVLLAQVLHNSELFETWFRLFYEDSNPNGRISIIFTQILMITALVPGTNSQVYKTQEHFNAVQMI